MANKPEEKALIKMQFTPVIAKEAGVEEAIMYGNIEFWCAKNKANNKHFYDRYYWTYNTQEAFEELFWFWTRDQIRRILKNLEDRKYIKVGNYNKTKYDRTKWYATIWENPPMEVGKIPNGNGETHQPIPDSKPNNKPISFEKDKISEPDQLAELERWRTYWNRFLTAKDLKISKVRNRSAPNKLLPPCKSITQSLRQQFEFLIAEGYSFEDFQKAVRNYITEILNRGESKGNYENHRFSFYEFLKNENGFVKFLNK